MTSNTQHTPIVSIIAAMAKNRVIGSGDKIPWHIPEDFQYFKEKTLGKPIIMGRATFESIHKMKGTDPLSGSCLSNRYNIVVTRQSNYKPVDCGVCHSLRSAIDLAAGQNTDEIMICGGGQIYTEALSIADRLYITEINENYEGDVFFPEWDKNIWSLTSSNPRDGFIFNIFDKK